MRKGDIIYEGLLYFLENESCWFYPNYFKPSTALGGVNQKRDKKCRFEQTCKFFEKICSIFHSFLMVLRRHNISDKKETHNLFES